MAESPSQAPTPTAPAASDTDTTQYWCYHCEKRVSIETLANIPDVICLECKNGFVESIPATLPQLFSPPSLTPDHVDDRSRFLRSLRLIVQAMHDEDAPQQRTQEPHSEENFLRAELDGWENDEEHDDDASENDENEENRNDIEEENENENEENEGVEDRSNNENEENLEDDDEEVLIWRLRDELRLRPRESVTLARTRRNRILDWADILTGLEDNSIELRLEVSDSDRYIGSPEDYVDAAGYEALLQNLAESDGGRRGAPPAAKSAVLKLPTVEILSEQETIVCAICKDMINVGETATKLPCGHGYHWDCIVTWLGSRNTCPVCRFELPADDFEEERKKRVPTIVCGASGLAGENSSLG